MYFGIFSVSNGIPGVGNGIPTRERESCAMAVRREIRWMDDVFSCEVSLISLYMYVQKGYSVVFAFGITGEERIHK